jgi:outer membrane protein TolC
MRSLNHLALLGCVLLGTALHAQGQTNQTGTNGAYTLDLPTVLRLANAQNLDVQIARERLAEARAHYESATMQFLPWLAPGISFRRHENFIQDVAGNIIDVHKESYAPGVTLNAQIVVGDAIFNSLSARQNLRASGHAVEVQRQISVLAAVQGYFDLAQAQAQVEVAKEAQQISRNLEQQLTNAVSAGIAYKGDQLRAQVQSGRNDLAVRQAQEQQRTAGARLAEVLHLDATVELLARETELLPLSLIASNAALGSLVEQALAHRPELRQTHELLAAANSTRRGTTIGPLIPSLGGQAFIGGLGGGIDHQPSRFGESEDYAAYLSWRIGPGGLFDFSRTHLAESQLAAVKLGEQKIRDQITREVVEGVTRFRSLGNQLELARHNVEIATEAEQLAEQRKEFAVGIALEDIQTQQDLTRARSDLVNIVAEFNKAQYTLLRATGNLAEPGNPPAPPTHHSPTAQ